MPLKKILLVDDDLAYYDAFYQVYEGKEYEILKVEKAEDGIKRIRETNWDAVIFDLDFGHGYEDGLENKLKPAILRAAQRFPVVVITSDGTSTTRLKAIEIGATEIIDKLFVLNPDEIHGFISGVIDAFSKRKLSHFPAFSASTRLVKKRLIILSKARKIPVLITGEVGVNKELAIRGHLQHKQLHPFDLSTVGDHDFQEQFCGKLKLKEEDSEQGGQLAKAGHDLLYLTGIENTTPFVQDQLEFILKNWSYQPLGASKAHALSCQLVFASSKHLSELVVKGTFKKSLYDQLNYQTVYIPPLRERLAEIELLTDFLINQLIADLDLKMSMQGFKLPAKLMERFKEYHWPGNDRELADVLKRILLEIELSGTTVIGDIFLTGLFSEEQESLPTTTSSYSEEETKKQNRAEFRCKFIQSTIIQSGGLRRAVSANDWDVNKIGNEIFRYYNQYPSLFLGQDLRVISDKFAPLLELKKIEQRIRKESQINAACDLLIAFKSDKEDKNLLKTIQASYNRYSREGLPLVHPEWIRIESALLDYIQAQIDGFWSFEQLDEAGYGQDVFERIERSLIDGTIGEAIEQLGTVAFGPENDGAFYLLSADYDLYMQGLLKDNDDNFKNRIQALSEKVRLSAP